jgi:hypothetical protein
MSFENKLKLWSTCFKNYKYLSWKYSDGVFWCPIIIKPIARTETPTFEAIPFFLIDLLKNFKKKQIRMTLQKIQLINLEYF